VQSDRTAFYFELEKKIFTKKAKTVLPDGDESYMETSLKYMFRKVRGDYPLKSILSRSGIRVIYLVFRKLYPKHNISFVKLNS